VLLEPLACRVDVIHLVGEMPERAADLVVLGIPVVRELDLRLLIARRGEKYEREPPFLILRPPHFPQAERIAEELQRSVEIADANHGVEVFHKEGPRP